MPEAYIVSACRTAIGKFQGAFTGVGAPQLGAVVLREALRRAGVGADLVDEVIMGNVLQAGLGQNPARQAARGAGIPDRVGSFTVNKVCGSGLKSVMLAAQAIRAGDADLIVAGGMENMTRAPYLLPQAREGQRLGHGKLVDAMIADGLWDVSNDFHMGNTAELVCDKYAVSRQDQDRYAAESHRRAVEAQGKGLFKEEIVAVEIPDKKGTIRVETDESPRADSTAEKLANLKAAFKKDGSVTAGNASSINDGAAAVVVASERFVKEKGLKPLARITGAATGGVAPEWVMMAPLEAVANLAARTKKGIREYDLVEINEAFSAAAVALTRKLELDAAKVNVNGGAVALGHPIGASGCRILVTLLHALRQRDLRTGVATLCLGGGNAVAMSVERV
ncbi:MAG: acetyl-CoA C-acetyltransferase [Candidatus Brocadiae bacterium]|nr:acetyl-CoA C-acetyltransferase [Candidatus Brocadiia bacterium]